MQLEIMKDPIEVQKQKELEAILDLKLSTFKKRLLQNGWKDIDVKRHFEFLANDYDHNRLWLLAKKYMGAQLVTSSKAKLSDLKIAERLRAELFYRMLNDGPRTDFIVDFYLKKLQTK